VRETGDQPILLAVRPDASARRPVQTRIFSFPMMLAGLLVVLAVLTVRSRFDDPDMWWHLKTGEIIWSTHTIPAADLFSYTTNHHRYVAHEWLAQLLIYGAYRLGGYPGLMLWLCFFTAALLLSGYYLCALCAKDAKVGFLGALTIWLFATIGFAIRPQMIGYLLFEVELILLHLGRTRTPRWFYGLPLLFALWVNCHGSFFLGLIVAGILLLSSLLNFQKGSLVALAWPAHVRSTLFLCFLLSIAALFVNPIGLRQILYPLDMMFRQPVALRQIDEWKPLPLGDVRSLVLLSVLGAVFLLCVLRKRELLWHELMLLPLAAWLAISHRRMLFPCGILIAPILSRILSGAWQGDSAKQDRPALNAVLLGVSLLTVCWALPDQQALALQVEQKSPTKAVQFIKAHHLSGRMLNEFSYGGYLIWELPENPVFVDGRSDIFEETGVLSEFGRWATLQSDPQILLDRYGIDFCVLSRGAPMVRVLPLLRSWSAVYMDENSVIFERAVGRKAP
jgi:hypothetical protein